MRHIIPISGKDSLATAILQTARQPELNYEYVFNPTGLELPDVLVWLDEVEKYLGKKIVRVGKDLKAIIEGYNYYLPSGRQRYCTRESKIEPFIKWIGSDECTVYYGIRADENRTGFDNSTAHNITPKYPLAEMGIDINGVYLLINSKGLKPPTFFWPQLYEKVKRKLGYDPKPLIPEWVFDHLFAWRSRANCDRCFNQRMYEWVGLLTFHPDLFWDAERMEHLGSETFKREPKEEREEQFKVFSREVLESLTVDGKQGIFTWSGSQSLEEIAKKANKVFELRAAQVAKSVHQLVEVKVFQDEAQGEIIDTLFLTSCGLMCGK